VTTPTVTAIVVNYRTAALTIDAVESALREPEVSGACIVDNASGADDVAMLRGYAGGRPVVVIANDDNEGFGRAVNRAAATGTTDHLLLLNSDAIVAAGSVGALVEVLGAEPEVGIVAPSVRVPGGALQVDAFGAFPSLRHALLRTNRRHRPADEPDWVSGVAMLVRRLQFLGLGGFDEEFFMYLEDVDLCRRYRAAGAHIRRVPSSTVTHLGGASRDSTRAQEAQYRRSLDRYLAKAGRTAVERRVVLAGAAGLSRLRSSRA
jgi:GT2 family glycosyltransferase